MSIYITDKLEVEEYSQWLSAGKIILNAPTGMGKTFFVLRKFIPYCISRRKKVLLLCNRRLLKMQYGYDVAEFYDRYADLAEHVEIMTYQRLSEIFSEPQAMREVAKAFDIVICDEVHFFYNDSDFNPEGTYVLLQKIISAFFWKTLIMITATIKEVRPLLDRTLRQWENKIREETKDYKMIMEPWKEWKVHDFSTYADFSRFHCYFASDEETLAGEIAGSAKKTLVFIDDKTKAERFKELLVATKKLSRSDIFLLNAQVMDERSHDHTIRALAIRHLIVPRVLITTSVLDNGVSIHDESVGNVVIATDSQVSFMQMIGRIRAEKVDVCRLYIYPRKASYYLKRIEQYEVRLDFFNEMEDSDINANALALLRRGWYGKDEQAEFLRNAVVITNLPSEYYGPHRGNVTLLRSEVILALNRFAWEKSGNMLLEMRRCYTLALADPSQVACAQIAWIGKTPEELEIIGSTYREARWDELKQLLLSVQDVTNKEFQEIKSKIAEEYRYDILSDVVQKSESFATKKLQAICEKVALRLEETTGTDGKKRYTIKQEDE